MSSKPKGERPPIDDFNGYYEYLNNDYPTWIQYEGIQFPNVTTAFQAARTPNVQLRKKISQLQNYEEFKQLASNIKNPENWLQVRYKVMQKLLRDKFKRNKEIANKLASTEDRKLYNCFKQAGDNQMYWGCVKTASSSGVTQYKGANNLGKILENIRLDIIKMQDTEKWISFQNLQEDQQLFPEVSITVLKEGQPIDKLLLEKRNYFIFGSHPKANFQLQHPSISKFHSVVYFSQLEVVIVDTNSTHGTFVQKRGDSEKTRLQPLQKRALENGDTIFFGMSSRTYVCNISFQKAELALKRKQQEIEKNINQLKQVNSITSTMDRQQIKSKIGFKKYQGIYVQNIHRNYSYNDIKELFQKYGKIEKIRMIQNYKDGRFEGEVIVLYELKNKLEDIFKQIKQQENKEIQKMQLKLVDKYDVEKILSKGKQDREKQRSRRQQRDKAQERKRSRSKERRRSRSREKERKEKHKKYDKYDREDDDRRRER